MSLLDQFPHECTVRRRVRTKGELGGSKASFTDEQTGVACWEQVARHAEVEEFQKKGMGVSSKVFFTSDPNVSARHQILITKRNGVSVSSLVPLDVQSEAIPDATAGLGVVFKVMCGRNTGEDD